MGTTFPYASVVCPTCDAQVGEWCRHGDTFVGGALGEHPARNKSITAMYVACHNCGAFCNTECDEIVCAFCDTPIIVADE